MDTADIELGEMNDTDALNKHALSSKSKSGGADGSALHRSRQKTQIRPFQPSKRQREGSNLSATNILSTMRSTVTGRNSLVNDAEVEDRLSY